MQYRKKDVKQLDFEIDKLTRSIENVITGDSFPTEVLPLGKPDLSQLTKKNKWKFNWKEEYNIPDREIFKLTIVGNYSIIQGVVSATMSSGYVEMPLIETAPFNYGSHKMYSGVAGNLVAFVCKLSFERGFDGYVGFIAKVKLIEHYEKTLGAVHIGTQRMIIQQPQAKVLVNKYFPTFKIE